MSPWIRSAPSRPSNFPKAHLLAIQPPGQEPVRDIADSNGNMLYLSAASMTFTKALNNV
jgi:hypothetical protein